MRRDVSPRILYGAIALLLVVVGALGYALWQESRTETIEFSIGEGELEVHEG
ncbi:hypothetical protein [Marinicauda algicola]|uniref:hypothetical protein n=1 Tax=Marinicauda algicola TaxID=2029849 RepID=UPI0013053910|nr:hypothetical protein [Marinicauda algicola]